MAARQTSQTFWIKWGARMRVGGILLCLAAGLLISAMERYRPSMIDPVRSPIHSLITSYVSPIRKVTKAALQTTGDAASLWEVEKKNQQLQRELIEARARLQHSEEQLRRLTRISGLRQWERPEELEFILADVTGFSTHNRMAELFIDRGVSDGVEIGLPVVGQQGLAGVVRETTERTARIQALSDPQSVIGVADARTRARGLLFGRGRDLPLEFVPENENEEIRPGSVLITSGLQNSVYPRGLVVGVVQTKKINDRAVTYGEIRPAENFSALEEVLVIRRSRAPIGEGGRDLSLFTLDMPTTVTLGANFVTSTTLLSPAFQPTEIEGIP